VGTLSYDAAGDVTNDGVNQYIYNANGQICAVESYDVALGMMIMTGYIYDADGNRVAKGSITTWGSCDPVTNGFIAGSQTDYVRDQSGNPLSEFVPGTNGAITLQSTNVWADGMLIATDDSTETHFYLNDWLGTRRVQTSYAGAVEQTCTSLLFGDADNCSAGVLFTGKERDQESGLDNFGARYYASTMGRMLSPDPEGPTPLHLLNPQRWNMYSYGLNNPLSFTDSGGRDAAAVNFSKEIVMVGHEGIMSVTSNGTVRYARFGPVGGNRPFGKGLVQSFTLKTKIQFDSNGNPTAASLNAVKKELATSDLSPEKGQAPSTIRINYFKTTDQETENLNQWIDQQQAASNQGKATPYNVTTTNCTLFCVRGLVAAGVLNQNQASHASPAPNDFWWQLENFQPAEPCARTGAIDSQGNWTGWSPCQ